MIKKPISRTQTPGYFFSAGKAAESRKRRRAERQPAKLPTSVDEMKEAEARKIQKPRADMRQIFSDGDNTHRWPGKERS